MSEKPIIFSTPMVRAILDGRKTQTRRAIKPQPIKVINKDGIDILIDDGKKSAGKRPYCKGDILWVRETWQSLHNMLEEGAASCVVDRNFYKADYQPGALTPKEIWDFPYWNWRPSIIMPRAAARLFLEVKAVRAERLQDITTAEAIKEGLPESMTGASDYSIRCFHSLWDTLNAKRGYGWDKNPWVWVIGFRMIDAVTKKQEENK